jgi:uncharacterized protein (DUF983 family)
MSSFANNAGGELRNWKTGIRRGLACRCPACGEGRTFGRFLKVNNACRSCGEELHHHRADDLPPYLTIFIVGHIVGYGIFITEMRMGLPLTFQLVFWPLMTLGLSLALIQPLKGAVVGLQYALGMHGFEARDAAATPDDKHKGPSA